MIHAALGTLTLIVLLLAFALWRAISRVDALERLMREQYVTQQEPEPRHYTNAPAPARPAETPDKWKQTFRAAMQWADPADRDDEVAALRQRMRMNL